MKRLHAVDQSVKLAINSDFNVCGNNGQLLSELFSAELLAGWGGRRMGGERFQTTGIKLSSFL